MSSESSSIKATTTTEFIYVAEIEESSEDPPMEEWSSLEIQVPEENKKRALYQEGLYSPGSGELCLKYIAMSDSAVFRHPYYNYPAVIDPGIEKAILQPEEKITYSEDGQELYLALCEEMNQCPVRLFHEGLMEEVIDLKYYCLNRQGVRAMAMALEYNRTVKVLDLTDNFLNDDACVHLGEMLTLNTALSELILDGCRIGPSGLQQLAGRLPLNRGLRVLNLSRNRLGDKGVKYLAEATFRGIDVQKLNLSHNDIGPEGLNTFIEPFETHNHFTLLDLSWNNLYPSEAIFDFLTALGDSEALEELNLSWNSLSGGRVGLAIKNLMYAVNLQHLNISNNMLRGKAITYLLRTLARPKKMETLDLSYNPLSIEDAIKVLHKVALPSVEVKKLLLDNVTVNDEFLQIIETMKTIDGKMGVVITYGYVSKDFKPVLTDIRDILLNRADSVAKRAKKNPVDIGLLFLKLHKEKGDMMNTAAFVKAVRLSGAPLENELLESFMNVFPGPKVAKSKFVDLSLLVDYVHRKWPDRELPPTPPPEPEPPKRIKKTKGKGKRK